MMAKQFLFILLPFALASMSYRQQPQNHAPVVKIIAPANNAGFSPGAQVSYQVSVADKEDGDTRYDEINVKEIVLELQYVKDKAKASAMVNKPFDDAPGLAVMRSSNCFNCHDFNGKSIGPSFLEISKRYPATTANTDSLVKRVKDGSAGIWGLREKMPPHPELSAQEIKSAIQWIFKNAADQGMMYYDATPGIIRLPAIKTGAYVLTASYTDHGIKNTAEKHLTGYDRIVIVAK
ncbi:c-type cytochrome [Mucilaginibacter ginsenosidivorans]|uniref:C-type cytochrome n=1 Tax=Mucilaginibacter ginsenosidivorans TaxID=398053 RepID=A0A5B8UXF6_9SPHI|nr:c-type cytochrome [Mucilaginibacter ginsenosidivorans]QEC63770.1 c-type cytochrome [Mucilaginibacter ginsenosidivorans]